jgi:V8-like Glu-specific endopeptidase
MSIPSLRLLLPLLISLLILPLAAGHAGPERPAASAEEQAFGLRSTTGVAREAARNRAGQLHAFLDAERPGGVAKSPVVVRVTKAELRSIEAPHPEGLVKVGFSKVLPAPVAFARDQHRGTFAATEDGGFVWSVAIRSPGASAMRLRFAQVRLPDDADLYVYNDFGDAKGPYQGQGPHGNGSFWSHTVAGDTAVVQVRYFGRASEEEIRATSVVVTHVGHLTSKFRAVASPEAFCSAPDGGNADCVEDGSCYNESAVADAKDAVALILWPQGPFFYVCSGGLLADTAGSETPYFLTANHCISRAKDAKNVEAHFGFATTSCGNDYPIVCEDWRGLVGNGVLGATLLATGSGSDFTLLQLSGPPPAGSAFLGWTSTPVASSDGDSLHRISHPNAAPQAYSRHTVDTGVTTCGTLPRGNFIYSRDEVGGTEGGSSGSPVVNSLGQVVGQLYGACGFNLEDVCDADSNATVDGAFASYFGQVAGFLAGEPSAEVCDDGQDNDLDGLIDCQDPDCAGHAACGGGMCTGGQKFDACTSNADCCSNKCKGPANNMTCR